MFFSKKIPALSFISLEQGYEDFHNRSPSLVEYVMHVMTENELIHFEMIQCNNAMALIENMLKATCISATDCISIVFNWKLTA